MALVSVVIPTFNRARTLPRALESVRAQSFRDFELLVVDDASTDETVALIGADVKLVRLEKNLGVAAARNAGVAAASGKWIAFLDSDDEWLPRKLERQLELTPRFDLIHCEEMWIRNGTRVNPMKKHTKSGGRIFRRCVEICCVSASTTMLSRELFERSGGFDPAYPVCEDYALWLKITAREDVGFVQEPMIRKYGGHADQLSTSRTGFDFYRVCALAPFLRADIGLEDKIFVAENIAHRARILLNGYLKHGNFSEAPQVQAWADEARSFLTASQSAHSAADLRPRSVSTTVL